MHSLLKILLLLVCLKLNEIDGRIHVQPIVCSEVIPSSLDYSLDIEQIDDDHKLSMEVTVHGKTSDITFSDATLVAKDVNDRIIGSWTTKDPTMPIKSTEKFISILHIDHNSIQNIRMQVTIETNTTTVYLNCYDVTLKPDTVYNSDNSLNHNYPVNTRVSTLLVTSVTQTSSPTANVGVNITWTCDSNKVTQVKMFIFNMNAGQWAALGFSNDGSMGESHVFICRRLSNDTVDVNRYINPRGHSRPVPAGSEQGGVFTVESQGIENGVVFCQFTLSNFSLNDDEKSTAIQPLSQSTPYYPLFAIGQLDASNNLKQHGDDSHDALTQLVVLNRAESFTFHVNPASDDSKTKLLKAHGIIMVFTWIFIASTGIILARYFKRSWPEQTLCGKPIWYSTHRLLMSLVSALTLLGFMFVLVYTGGQWVKEDHEKAHAIIGAIVTGLAFIQPFMALFRCDPDSPYRFIFNYVHALVGTSAFLLSIVTLFLATTNFKGIFSTSAGWILMTIWVCWIVCLCLILEYLQRRNPSISTERIENYSRDPILNNQEASSSTTPTNQGYERLKIILFLLHLCVAIAIPIALVVIIAKFE